MIKNYYYNKQIKKAVIVFANIFAGMKVRTGLDACGQVNEIDVPIRYGSTDRVASSIAASNTQNNLYTLPMMTCYITNMELAPDRIKGLGHVSRERYVEQGGVIPDDIKAIKRQMPIPYNLVFELAIHASNTDQAYQLLEQIMILFDYDLQVQFNDAPFDWAKITSVELTGINNEENYPVGTEKRMLIWTLSFNFPIWISPPYEVRTDIIRRIVQNFGDLDKFRFEEYDENGELAPFTDDGLFTQSVITKDVSVIDPPIDEAGGEAQAVKDAEPT